jgi:hypothetical protein
MSNHTALDSVGPRDCALGMAIPLDAEAFTRDLAPTVDKDFAKHFLRMNAQPRPLTDEFYADTFMAAAAGGIERACAAVEGRGVTVVRNLTLAELPQLFVSAKVVTIFAHWLFKSIKDDDIINRDAILALLRCPREEIHELVREEVLLRQPDFFESEGNGLAALLNEIASKAREAYLLPGDDCEAGILEAEPRTILHRVAFESAFEGAIRPARAIELFD